jgi:multiple sugar transport system substrate-binding protein
MRKLFNILCLVMALTMLITACGGGQPAADEPVADVPSGDEPVADVPSGDEPAVGAPAEEISGTVRMYKGPFGPDEVALQNEIVARFNEEYPNIEVIFEVFDWPTQEAQITAALAGGTHDLIYVPEGMYPKFAYQGGPIEDVSWCVDDPAWAEERDNVLYWDVATSPDGLLGGIPNVWIPESHFVVNVDMLKEAGVPDDWNASLEGVRDAAIAVHETFPDAYGIAWRTAGLANFSQHDWYGYMLRSGANYLNEDFTACGMNTPELVETFQWLVDLQNMEGVTPEPGAYTWDGLRGLFQGGKLAITHDEPPLAGALASNPPDFEYAMTGIPGLVNDNLLTFRGFYVIPTASKNKEAACEVAKFWVKPENEVWYLNRTSGLYPALADTGGIEVFPDDAVLASGMDLAQYAEGPQFHKQMVEFQNLVQPLFDEMMLGNITPQELIDDACVQIEAKLR